MRKSLFFVLFSSFVFGNQVWNKPATELDEVETDGDIGVSVVMDADENAIAAFFGDIRTVFVSRSLGNTVVWSLPPEEIADADTNSVGPGIGINAAGDATVVLAGSDFGESFVQASRYSIAANNWFTPFTLTNSTTPQAFAAPDVAMDSAGNAMAVWRIGVGTFRRIQASYFDAATLSWDPVPTTISSNSATTIFVIPKVSMDAAGNALAVWAIQVGGIFRVEAARFDAATKTWFQFPQFLSANTQSAFFPEIAADPFGNAIAVWYRGGSIKWSRYDVATNTWSSEANIPLATGEFPQIGSDSQGNMIAVWTRTVGGNPTQASRYDVQTGQWQAMPDTISAVGHNTKLPRLAVNDNGNAVAIYSIRPTNSNRIFATCYDASTQMWDPMPVSLSGNFFFLIDDGVAIGPRNGAAAVWASFGSPGVVQAIRGVAVPPVPPDTPRDLVARIERIQFPCKTKTTCLLTWKKSLTPDVAFYRVLRNGRVIGRVEAGCPLFFVDDDPPKKGEVVYSVVAVDKQGVTSEAATTTKKVCS